MEKNIGPINSIVLSRSKSDNIYKQDTQSIINNGLTELKIIDNQIMNANNRSEYLDDLLETLDSIEYYLNDYSSTGIMYYDLLDRYNVTIGENAYSCIMFNDEQDITQGLEEQVYTDRPETSQTDYSKADSTDLKINQTNFIVDKQGQSITGIISQIGDRTDKTTTITADITGLQSQVSEIATYKEDVTGTYIVQTSAETTPTQALSVILNGAKEYNNYLYCNDAECGDVELNEMEV